MSAILEDVRSNELEKLDKMKVDLDEHKIKTKLKEDMQIAAGRTSISSCDAIWIRQELPTRREKAEQLSQ